MPWAGGLAVESELERYAGQLASQVAGRPVTAICDGAADWGRLAGEEGFDAVSVWGYVPFAHDEAGGDSRPTDRMHLSEAACWYLDRYWAAPAAAKGKVCRAPTGVGRREKRVKRVRVCSDYRQRTFALQAISHESQHLAGVADEAEAECKGMHMLGWFAERFGATAEQARQMAADYYSDFYLVTRPGTPYFQPGCPSPAG